MLGSGAVRDRPPQLLRRHGWAVPVVVVVTGVSDLVDRKGLFEVRTLLVSVPVGNPSGRGERVGEGMSVSHYQLKPLVETPDYKPVFGHLYDDAFIKNLH